FKRLPFGVTASPSILNMCLTSFLNTQNSEISAEIAKNMYVDNIMMSAETVEEAMDKYYESKRLFAKIGMNLREYISNSPEVNAQIPECDRLESGNMKLLGIKYDVLRDTFQIKTEFKTFEKLTKKI
ncbi:hypothetical protein OESDEN_23835, partial [Oesophagostomum dentatum]